MIDAEVQKRLEQWTILLDETGREEFWADIDWLIRRSRIASETKAGTDAEPVAWLVENPVDEYKGPLKELLRGAKAINSAAAAGEYQSEGYIVTPLYKRPPSSAGESPTEKDGLWNVVRLLAEGSDWKRDSGESLGEWAGRKIMAASKQQSSIQATTEDTRADLPKCDRTTARRDDFEEWMDGFWPGWALQCGNAELAKLRTCWNAAKLAVLRTSPSSAMPSPITATRIHDVYQEEFYRKDKTGKALAHPTHADLIKAVIHRLLGVEITEPWRGEPVGEGADSASAHK